MAHPPRGRQQNALEECFDQITGRELGIDENDLWIVCQAIDHELTLVTNDYGIHDYIKPCCNGLLDAEDWEIVAATPLISIPFATNPGP